MNTTPRNSAAPPARNMRLAHLRRSPSPFRYRTYFATFAETYPEFMTTLIV